MSSDSTKPGLSFVDDKFEPVKDDPLAQEVAGLSQRFGQFVSHIDTRFDLLIEKLIPMWERSELRQDDFAIRLNRHEKELEAVKAEVNKLRQSAERRRKGTRK